MIHWAATSSRFNNDAAKYNYGSSNCWAALENHWLMRPNLLPATCACWRMPSRSSWPAENWKRMQNFVFYSKNHFLLLPRHLHSLQKSRNIYLSGKDTEKCSTSPTISFVDTLGYTGWVFKWRCYVPRMVGCCWDFAYEINLSQFSFTIDMSLELEILQANDTSDLTESCAAQRAAETLAGAEMLADSLARPSRFKDLFFIWVGRGNITRKQFAMSMR